MKIINLEPPDGVPPIRIGMALDEARVRLSGWGDVTPFRRTADDTLGWMVLGSSLQGFVYVDKEDRVDSIELAHPPSKDVDVRYRGVSIFGKAALDVLAGLEGLGVRLDVSDPHYPGGPRTVPRIRQGIWRGGVAHRWIAVAL